MSVLNDIFGSGFDLYKFLSQKSRARNTTKQLIYRELNNNMQRLEHRNKKGVDRFVLIQKLENDSLINAIKEGFDFKQLAPKEVVDEKIIEIFSHAKRYKGWHAAQVIFSIDEKITALKDVIELYPNVSNAPIDFTKRLNNLFILNVLLVILIKKASVD